MKTSPPQQPSTIVIVPRSDEIVVSKSSLTMVRSENWSPLPRRSNRSDPSWKPKTASPKKLS